MKLPPIITNLLLENRESEQSNLTRCIERKEDFVQMCLVSDRGRSNDIDSLGVKDSVDEEGFFSTCVFSSSL